MAILTRTQLKALWVNLFKPTETDYSNLFDSYSNMHRPTTEPIISGGGINLDCNTADSAMFEPRKSTPVRTIDSNVVFNIINDTITNLISIIVVVTGGIDFEFPPDVVCSNPSSIGSWDSGLYTLSLSAGVDDRLEFQLMFDKTADQYILKVSEVVL